MGGVTEYAPTIRGLKHVQAAIVEVFFGNNVTEYAPTIRGLKRYIIDDDCERLPGG